MSASQKIEKLFRMLGSPNENEASVALAKLKEELAKEKLSMNDIADTIVRKTVAAPPAPPPEPEVKPHQGQNWYDVSDPQHTMQAAYCRAFRHRMRDKDRDFIESIWKWMEKGRPLSTKQAAWLADLHERCARMKGFT